MNQPIAISSEALQAELLRRRYIELLEAHDVFPSQKNWDYIIKSAMGGEIGPLLYRKYLVSLLTPTVDRVDSHLAAIREFPRYLEAIGYDEAVNAVFSDVDTLPEETLKLARKYRLFSPKVISRLIFDGRPGLAVEFLSVFKPEYTEADLREMQSLVRCLDNLPELGVVEMSKGVFKNGMRYICPEGHINNPDDEFCSRPDCGLDIHGLTRAQCESVDAYRHLVSVLADMLAEASQQK